jgi:malate synthase
LEIFQTIMQEELEKIKRQIGGESVPPRQFDLARELFSRMVSAKDFPEFLTLPAYEELLKLEKRSLSA